VIDAYSQLSLANRLSRRCGTAEDIDTFEQQLKFYTPPTHLRMDNGSEFIATVLQEDLL